MDIIIKKINELKPYDKNPRKNDAAVPKVMESIKKFGFKVPMIITKDGVIVTGHTRFKAAKKLGFTEVPCIIADDLSEDEIKAFRLADNKVSEFSVWDYDLLSEELSELPMFDMSSLGFSMDVAEMQPDEVPEEKPKREKGYSIVYELAFSDEAEQEEWYDMLAQLKRKFPDVDTISGRVLVALRDYLE